MSGLKSFNLQVIEIIHHDEIPYSPEIPERIEVIREAGDLYSIRYTEFLLFVSMGFEERLKRLENL